MGRDGMRPSAEEAGWLNLHASSLENGKNFLILDSEDSDPESRRAGANAS
jgi:hypothetical protein